MLDLSATFDKVEHEIWLECLKQWVALSGPVLNWFKNYLLARQFSISIGDFASQKDITCVVPKGSILGPLLFSLYMLPLSQVVHKHNVNDHNDD